MPQVQYRDVVTSYLKEDTRILASELAAPRRIYKNDLYDVYLCIYSGLVDSPGLHQDLVTCLVVFKKENLRIMYKLWTDDIEGDRSEYFFFAVQRLENEGNTPLQLVRNAKVWSGLPLTQEDLAVLG